MREACSLFARLGDPKMSHSHFHILRLFDVLLNFPFSTGETMRKYY